MGDVRSRVRATLDPEYIPASVFIRRYGYLPEEDLRRVLAADNGFRCSPERVEELMASRFRPFWSPPFLARFLWHLLQPADLRDCWDWDAGSADRHGVPNLNTGGKPVSIRRLSFLLYVARFVPTDKLVISLCGEPRCSNPAHLFAGDHQQATAGKVRRGEDHPCAKLTEAKVLEIRGEHERGVSYGELAERFAVTRETVRDAAIGKRWSHIPA